MQVESHVRVYESNGKEVPIGEQVMMQVRSHWNDDRYVVIVVQGASVAVLGKDLEAAIKNARNTGRW